MGFVKTLIGNYLIVSALLPTVLLWNPPPAPKSPVCTKGECKQRGSLYYQNMNDQIHPCRDFYKFACGGWSKQHPRPAYELQWSVHELMQREVLDQLQTLLKRPEKSSDPEKVKRAKKIFKICMQIPSLEKGGVDFLTKHMDKVGRYPEKSIWDIHNGYVKMTGESPLFDIQITANSKLNDEPLLQFKEIKSPYGTLVFLGQWTSAQTRSYITFLVNLAKTIRNQKLPELPEKTIIRIVQDVLVFRKKLNQFTRKSLKEESDPLEPMTLQNLQKLYNRHAQQMKTTQINFDTIVRNLYSGQSDATLKSNPIVGFRRKIYFLTLAEFLAETSEETLAYHFELYFAERHVTLTPVTVAGLNEIVSKMNGFTGYVRKDKLEKSIKCVEGIDLDEAEGRLYINHHFKKKNIPVVEDMLEHIRDAIRKDIMDAKWPDYETKVATIRKINDINWWVGYPPWYDNPQLKPETTFMQPAMINANLVGSRNHIYVNAALMRSPLYDGHLPEVINYGAIGSTLGHEIYHALGDCSRFLNQKGEPVAWWSAPMKEKCDVQKQCFIKQYTALGFAELKSMKLIATDEVLALASDARNTFMEDLADVMGLQAAFRAFQAKLKIQQNICAVLPHFERYSCEQMFFISFANSMCGSQVPEIAYSDRRSHSPLSLRVNTVVSNSDDFRRAFGCIKDDPMYPSTRCNLWI